MLRYKLGLPGGPVVKSSPSMQEADRGLILGQATKIPYAARQPSPSLGACALQEEKPVHHDEDLVQPKKKRYEI